MRIEVHVKTEDGLLAARDRYRGPEYAGDDVVLILDQPVSSSPAERQDRKAPKGKF